MGIKKGERRQSDVICKTYACNMSEETVSIANGKSALAIAQVVHGAGEKGDVSWEDCLLYTHFEIKRLVAV